MNLDYLNERQLEAVTETEGYIRVIAGPGSGKTLALTARYAYIVEELGIAPSSVACMTFTNKAAQEMKKRVRSMTEDKDTALITTFHGFCVRFLKEDIHTLNFPKNFMVLDEDDQDTILNTVFESSGISSRVYTNRMAKADIEKMKSEGRHIGYLKEIGNTSLKEAYEKEEDIQEKVFLGYLYEQKKCFGLDFNDLLSLTLFILKNFSEKREKWQKRMEYVMVDEFQDVSATQYELADILSGYHKNLFVVGDPDQTIYSWRGADINFILNFDRNHPGTKTIVLNSNYRSIPEITGASEELISGNRGRIEKHMISKKESGLRCIYAHFRTQSEEAMWIADNILESHLRNILFSSMAVLYRAHYVSRNVEEAFIKKKIPYVLYSGVEFYKRREIKDVLAYLRMIIYSDDLSFLRVVNLPKRNIGRSRISFLKQYASLNNVSLYSALKDNVFHEKFRNTEALKFIDLIERYKSGYKEMTVSEVTEGLLRESGYEDQLRNSGEEERLENVAELKQSIYEYEKTSGEENPLDDYLSQTSLFTDMDRESKKDAVRLMTVHSAKGLEFSHVFITGFSEGIFPSSRTDTAEAMEEERRLAYVAYTRAEQRLYISDSEGSSQDGSFRYPSRFIFNTGRKFLDYRVELDERLREDTVKYIRSNESRLYPQDTPIKEGNRVNHKIFGSGTVTGINSDKRSYIIKFDKSGTERSVNFDYPLERR